uniref:Chromodomain-helicase-DNA-binding protein 1 n=1 Tax=Caenorhabditis japonica TaxID=281687 RepID=A0A8R1DYQ7_CAEJA
MSSESESSSGSDDDHPVEKPVRQEKSDSSEDSSEEKEDSEFETKVSEEANSPDSSSEQSDDSEEEEESSEPDEVVSKKKSNNRGMDDKTRKLLEEENYFRRSKRAKRADTSEDNSEKSESSDDDWEDRKKSKRSAVVKNSAQNKKKKAAASAAARRKSTKGNVDYTEKNSDDDIDDDDVLEWDEAPEAAPEVPAVLSENVEKIIKSRKGIVGATGSATTFYNMLEKGDPNENAGEKTEQQFLVKWTGWSHLHNTWESENSLTLMNAKGIKKLQNYIKKQNEVELWKRYADKEYIEFYECEQQMAEELCEEYKKVERVVAHQTSRDRALDGSMATEYLVKWTGLPYSDCTWEDEKMVPSEFVKAYHHRIENLKCPNKNSTVLRKRPKFERLETMPEFLKNTPDAKLRDYQLDGLNFMISAWCKGNSSILADEMGLGKTIQSISFLSSLFHLYDLAGPYLVVVPLSTMAAWQKEFGQWAPDMNLVVYMGDVVSRDVIRQYEWSVGGTKKMKVNAILTTYEILLKDKAFLSSVDWAAMLVDEAHRLKNEESLLYKCLMQFRFNHKLLITGTPLQNSMRELWALLHFIMPEKFDRWEDFEMYNERNHKDITALHKKLHPFLLRRVKKDVEKSLPPKTEQILRVDMTAHQKQFYKWILTKNYRELSKGVKGSINGFINLVMELKKCCNHASLIRQYDHIYDDAQGRLQQLLKSSGKLILLDKLLCRLKEKGHRVLIFSQMVMMLDVLQEYLQLRRFPSQRLDGSMRADLRKQALDHYNAPGSTDFAFLLSTRAGGLGINLATADTVIIFDSDWNPQNDLQAMSRAHRIGQTKTVSIYRLVTKGSVEEEIVERAKRKLVLDHLVIQRMDTTGKTVLSKSATATGSVPFDKQELSAILKFGAAELFKEKEGEEKEPEVDIDRILMGAETREADDDMLKENELLSSFKYATFAFDEEKDIAAATDEWTSIIPEEDRNRILEEERMKELSEMNLAPRQRAKPMPLVEDVDDEEEDDDDEGGGKKKKKKAFANFAIPEIKRFIKAFRKFAVPIERLEEIAQDAELEEHSTEEMRKLVESFSDACKKASDEFDSAEKNGAGAEGGAEKKDPERKMKFAQCDVNLKQIERSHTELKPLHDALKSSTKASAFKPPMSAKAQKGWDVEWKWVDDGALLWGVWKYGYGSWEAIKMDPSLGLADKIFIKDKTKKPQGKNLQQRVDYLLRLMKKDDKGKTVEKKERKRKAEETPVGPEKKKKHKNNVNNQDGEKKKKDKEKDSKNSTLKDQLALVTIDKSLYGGALEDSSAKPFLECVKLCMPVHKYMKKLKEAQEAKNQADEAKYLIRLGDSFLTALEALLSKKPKTNIRKWYNFLWIFLCKFTLREPGELADRYRNLTSDKQKNHHHHHHHHHQSKDERSKDHKDQKDHHKDKHRSEKRKGHGEGTSKDHQRGQHRDHHKDKHRRH